MARSRPARLRPSVRPPPGAQEPATATPGAFHGVSFSVPGKPHSVNADKRAVIVHGRSMSLTSREGREYRARVQAAARAAMGHRPLLTGDLLLEVWAYWPRRGADSDSPLKPLKDALQGIVYDNDTAVCSDQTYRLLDPENPRVVVVVRPAPVVVGPTSEFINAWHQEWGG